MSNPWKKVAETAEVENLSDIMSEEFARGLQVKENNRFADEILNQHVGTSEDISTELLTEIEDSKEFCDSDAVIAKVLQCQFDKEFDDELKRVERKKNGNSKVSISYDNYRFVPEHLVYGSDSDSEEEDPEIALKKDWDRSESNQKEYESLPKRGYIIKDGEMVTKHDSVINGRRNASRVMEFPLEICTGDGAGFDMIIPNSVYNDLKKQSHNLQARKLKSLDRKVIQATVELSIDEPSKLILLKLVNKGLIEVINGVISTGKESVVLHANGDPTFPDLTVPKECAIKLFKTTLNEFKNRDKYIEADYRFKDRFSKQNPRKIIHMWAEKEMHNMLRMQKIGINCPSMVCLKKHILVMSFIGRDGKPAPKLKDIILDQENWQSVYNEVIDSMYKLYNVGQLIHADLSEYNILWWDNKCWFIDVSQSVQPDHPCGLEFLLRDCNNVTHFFNRKNVPEMKSTEDLFKWITGFDEVDVNMLEGVHTSYNSLSQRFEITPDDNRNISYPFEYCFQKTLEDKGKNAKRINEDVLDAGIVDVAAKFGNVLTPEATRSSQELIIDKEPNFGNTLHVEIPSSSSIEKES